MPALALLALLGLGLHGPALAHHGEGHAVRVHHGDSRAQGQAIRDARQGAAAASGRARQAPPPAPPAHPPGQPPAGR